MQNLVAICPTAWSYVGGPRNNLGKLGPHSLG